MFLDRFLFITSLIFNVISTMITGTEVENLDTSAESWAIVPYELTQNNLFSTFNEKKRKFKFENIKDEIVISQNWDGKGVSAVVWEAAIELTDYLAKHENLKEKKVIELGAGTGLVGMVCSKLGANVTMTDIKEALPFLSKNIDQNFNSDDNLSSEVRELKWGENLHQFQPCTYDIIIGADVIYIEETFDDLMDTICYLAGCKGHSTNLNKTGTVKEIAPTVFLASKMRYTREERFMNRMKEYFHVDLVHENSNTNIHIYKALPR